MVVVSVVIVILLFYMYLPDSTAPLGKRLKKFNWHTTVGQRWTMLVVNLPLVNNTMFCIYNKTYSTTSTTEK